LAGFGDFFFVEEPELNLDRVYDRGGLLSWTDKEWEEGGESIVFIGIIDNLTKFTFNKQMANWLKRYENYQIFPKFPNINFLTLAAGYGKKIPCLRYKRSFTRKDLPRG
jgi:hypothetical protein